MNGEGTKSGRLRNQTEALVQAINSMSVTDAGATDLRRLVADHQGDPARVFEAILKDSVTPHVAKWIEERSDVVGQVVDALNAHEGPVVFVVREPTAVPYKIREHGSPTVIEVAGVAEIHD